jgi:hypothetical protein
MAFSFSPMVANDHIDSSDDPKQELAAQAAMNYRAAQAAIEGRKIRKAEYKEWAVAAVAIVCLMASLGALLVAHASYVWR